MQQPSQPNDDKFLYALSQMTQQLQKLGEQFDRLNERSRDFATRSDLKEMVAQRELEPQLTDLKAQIKRVNEDRIEDKRVMDKRMEDLGTEQISRQDRFGIRVSQAIAIAGFALALFEFLTHLKFSP